MKTKRDCGGISILLVDDDNASLFTLQAMLESFNCKVIAAANGFESLNIFKAKPNRGMATIRANFAVENNNLYKSVDYLFEARSG